VGRVAVGCKRAGGDGVAVVQADEVRAMSQNLQ
jgi:hypothetical protein